MTHTAEPLEGLRIPIVGSPEAPYRGIEPFRVVDAPIFFDMNASGCRPLPWSCMSTAPVAYPDASVWTR